MDATTKCHIAWFKECMANNAIVEKLKNIHLVLSDVDGALTDGSIYYSDREDGRSFSIPDGFMVEFLKKNNITLVLISGKSHESTIIRGQKLGISKDLCIVGKNNKIPTIQELQKKLHISPEQSLIFGDEVLELHVKEAGLTSIFACPQTAPFYVQTNADLVIPANAGYGCFRLLMDLMLYAQGVHFAQNHIQNALR